MPPAATPPPSLPPAPACPPARSCIDHACLCCAVSSLSERVSPCRNQSAMLIKSSRVLVLAMLSSASGWGLPSNDTGGVDGARDHRQRRLQNSAEPRFAEPQFPPYFVGSSGSATVSRQPPTPRACTSSVWLVPASRLSFCALSLSDSTHLPSRWGPALGLRRWQTLRSVRTLPRTLSR